MWNSISKNERRAIRRDIINVCLQDKSFPTIESLKFFVRLWERETFGYELISVVL